MCSLCVLMVLMILCSFLQVPLSGYGGTSKLLIEDVNSIGDTYTVNVGPVSDFKTIELSLKARNAGPRAAFVKIISFVGKMS